jgi:hypothetical protein
MKGVFTVGVRHGVDQRDQFPKTPNWRSVIPGSRDQRAGGVAGEALLRIKGKVQVVVPELRLQAVSINLTTDGPPVVRCSTQTTVERAGRFLQRLEEVGRSPDDVQPERVITAACNLAQTHPAVGQAFSAGCNVLIYDRLPAPDVNLRANLAVIHGRQGPA